ncbi:hypothetical protein EJ110_NYTH58076 [Nymphaea thermarum]|nr:hypothetical protein EJ110_NYTH58076 [Nymphaea thermarum]
MDQVPWRGYRGWLGTLGGLPPYNPTYCSHRVWFSLCDRAFLVVFVAPLISRRRRQPLLRLFSHGRLLFLRRRHSSLRLIECCRRQRRQSCRRQSSLRLMKRCRRQRCLSPFFIVDTTAAPSLSPVVFGMADAVIPKMDDTLNSGSNTKSENLPVHVTSIRLNKDNYLSWSAALEIDITSRSRLHYITGEKPAPSKTNPQWATWALEDSQVKVWIISSVSADIQPLILRKSTAYDMWTVLAKMYGRKKRVLRAYQIKRSIYALKQGDLSVASFYAALKTKWEELDYHVNDDWKCGLDHALYWEKEWMDRTFIFLGGLRDEFESIRSQILNCDENPAIEEVYARVESEEHRRQIMHIDPSQGSAPAAFVSRTSGTGQRPARRCSHCNKLDFLDYKADTVRDDRGSHLDGNSVDDQSTSRDHLFGQVYIRKKTDGVETDVVANVEGTNPNPVSAPDDPSPIDEELPIALRKGSRSCTSHPIQ